MVCISYIGIGIASFSINSWLYRCYCLSIRVHLQRHHAHMHASFDPTVALRWVIREPFHLEVWMQIALCDPLDCKTFLC